MAGMRQYKPATRGKHKGEVRFRCSWRNSDGRQLGKTMYGRRNAERYCSDMERGFINIDTGIYRDVEIDQTQRIVRDAVVETHLTRSFGMLATRFLTVKREEGDNSLATIEDYKQLLETHILPTLCDQLLDDIGLQEIEDMVMAIKSNSRTRVAGPRTINKCLTLLRSIFQYGIDLRWCTENPAKRKKPIKYQVGKKKLFEPAELWRIINNFEKPYDVAMRVLVFTGCRRGEAIALKWGDIDFEGATILFERSFKARRFEITPTKTKQRRRVPITDELLVPLRRLAAEIGTVDPGDWLFPDTTGVYPISGDVFRRRFNEAQKCAGLSGFVPHGIRHTLTTRTQEEGIDAASVQGLVGHLNLSTTLNHYTHSRMDKKREAAVKWAEVMSESAARKLPGSKTGSVTTNLEIQKSA